MKIPVTLKDWSLELLTGLLQTQTFEDEQFDLKERLPDPRDEKAKDRLRKICCAFANSEGGFIVFGVSDAKHLDVSQRLVGFDGGQDFPENFGNFPKACMPSVRWEFLNPPLSISNGRLIHVVHIPRSWRQPHAVDIASGALFFAKRTNKGNESMSVDEVRSSFLGFYEKRLKLQLLKSELESLKYDAQSCYVADTETRARSYQLITFDTTIVDSVIADTYAITSSHPALLIHLTHVRQMTRLANNRIQHFLQEAAVPRSNVENLNREHNQFLEGYAKKIIQKCDMALTELEVVLKP